MEVKFNVWNNDLSYAQTRYNINENAEVISVEIETENFKANKEMTVAEAEKLAADLLDHIRWIKEG